MKNKTKIESTALLTIIGLLLQGTIGVSEAAVLVTDPNDVGNNINTLGVSMSEEVGNTSLGRFNSFVDQYTFTMDTPAYPASPQTVIGNSFELTSGGSGVDKVLNMSASGGGFFQFNNTGDPRRTSGDQSLVRGTGGALTTTFLFDTAVQAFGFTANRLGGVDGLTVNLYSDAGSTLITSFAMSDNSNGHSFFGYTSAAQNILQIDLVGGASTTQYWIDDVSFSNTNTATAAPEPSTLALLGIGLLALHATRRKRVALPAVS